MFSLTDCVLPEKLPTYTLTTNLCHSSGIVARAGERESRSGVDLALEAESSSEPHACYVRVTLMQFLNLWCSMARQWMWQTGSAAFVPFTAHLMVCLKKSSRFHPFQRPKRDGADLPKRCCRGYVLDFNNAQLYCIITRRLMACKQQHHRLYPCQAQTEAQQIFPKCCRGCALDPNSA